MQVVGSHMSDGDLAAARLVCKRWQQLMRPAVNTLHVTPQQVGEFLMGVPSLMFCE